MVSENRKRLKIRIWTTFCQYLGFVLLPCGLNLMFPHSYIIFKVTVHVGTDQNFEIEIFAEYKYTLKMNF